MHARLPGPRVLLRVAGAGSALLPLAGNLGVDHRAERAQEREEAWSVPFERPEDVNERLDGRDVGLRRLRPYPVLARDGGGERVARKRPQTRVLAHDLLRLPPRPVDDDQRHRPARRVRQDVDRALAGIEQHWRARRVFEHAPQRLVVPPHAHVKLGAREAEGRHPRRTDGHVALARVLEDDDARRGRDLRDVPAVADARRPPARGADGARLALGRRGGASRRQHAPRSTAPRGNRSAGRCARGGCAPSP